MPRYIGLSMSTEDLMRITDHIESIGVRLLQAGLSDAFVESPSIMQELLNQEGEQVTLRAHEENDRIIFVQKQGEA